MKYGKSLGSSERATPFKKGRIRIPPVYSLRLQADYRLFIKEVPSRRGGGFLAGEMFLVVALALLLFGGTVYYFLQGSPYSRDNRRVSDLAQMSRALALYLDAEGRYPNGCEWSTDSCWKDFLGLYIKKVPRDPLNERAEACKSEVGCPIYRYCLLPGGRTFILAANLERPKKALTGDNSACSLGGPNQYWVTN